MILRKHVKDWLPCNQCSIASPHKVFYRGSTPCKYLFIGEAPGQSEVVTKKPFTGPAGKVLNSLLNDAGVTDFGITNVIACYPFLPESPSRFRKPDKTEIQNCKPRLNELLELVEANYYIALGKVAKTNPPDGVTYHLELDHPSYILRQGGVGSVEYKRNKHKLIRFIKETNG
jgi:uracil-DNA glycosylase